VSILSRNITIVIIILILVVLAGYLVWIRSKLAPVATPQVQITPTIIPTLTLAPLPTASPSATPTLTKGQKQASPTAKPK